MHQMYTIEKGSRQAIKTEHKAYSSIQINLTKCLIDQNDFFSFLNEKGGAMETRSNINTATSNTLSSTSSMITYHILK